MFVLQTNYNRVKNRCNELSIMLDIAISKYRTLQRDWNCLIDLINKKGGQEFLDKAKLGNKDFTKEEIKVLISLCHPDKHCGSKKAEEITKKLLSMR